jgi:hypothetical protein
MPIPVVCPSCTSRLRAPDSKAGRKTKCPKCGTAVVVPSLGEKGAELAKTDAPSQSDKWAEPLAARPSLLTLAPLRPNDFDLEPGSRHEPSAAATVSNTIIIQQPSRAVHSLGIAALVVGVLSFLVCWIPFLGMAVSGLGLLLGLGGIVLATLRRGSGIGFSIAGAGLSVLSLVICLLWTLALSKAFTAIDNGVAKQNRTNQNVVSDADRHKGAPEQPGSGGAPPATHGPQWADASKGAVQQGHLQVRVANTSIDKVPLKDVFREGTTSKDDLLMIKLELLNTNPTKKMEYRSWAGGDFSLDRDYATLKDNFGNSYKRITFGLSAYPVGAVQRSASIYPNKSVTDVLVFEVPLENIEYLRLELPAKNFDGTGMLRLQISKGMLIRRLNAWR